MFTVNLKILQIINHSHMLKLSFRLHGLRTVDFEAIQQQQQNM